MQTMIVALAQATVMPDGSTQPAGTAVNRIVADAGFSPGAGLELVADTGQALWAPAPPPPTTVSAYAFINRLTTAEQGAIMAAQPMWGVQVASLGTVDVTNAQLVADVAAAVSAGLLTQARATQILNLAVASP